MMYALLLATALLGADDQTQLREQAQTREQWAARSHHIDGAWQVVYVESVGKPLTPAPGHGSVTIQNNTVRFDADALKQPGTETSSPGVQAGRQGREAGRRGTSAGMQQSWRLEFGPNQTVRATPVSGTGDVNRSRQNPDQDKDQDRSREEKTDASQGREQTAQQGMRSGVYILSREYLCLSLRGSGSHGSSPAKETGRNEEPANETGRTNQATREAKAGHQAAERSSGSFIVILRRSQGEGQPGVER
jgi:hypothetical protein